MKIKYFENNKQYGIDYDWTLIAKEYNKLGIPNNVYNPVKAHNLSCGKCGLD